MDARSTTSPCMNCKLKLDFTAVTTCHAREHTQRTTCFKVASTINRMHIRIPGLINKNQTIKPTQWCSNNNRHGCEEPLIVRRAEKSNKGYLRLITFDSAVGWHAGLAVLSERVYVGRHIRSDNKIDRTVVTLLPCVFSSVVWSSVRSAGKLYCGGILMVC